MVSMISPSNTSATMNLLDNANFKDAINQRGQTIYAQNLYAIDRWVAWGPNAPNLTIETGGIRIAASETTASIYQLIDGLDTSKIYTLAVMAADGLRVLSGSFAAGIGVEHGLQIKMLGNYAQVVIAIKNTTLYWAALYEGAYTADTLPPYVPRGYAAELAECQRYYFAPYNNVGAVGVAVAEEKLNTHYIFPQTMRVVPTITIKNAKYYNNNTWTNDSLMGDTIQVTPKKDGFTVQFYASANRYTKSYAYNVIDMSFEASADL